MSSSQRPPGRADAAPSRCCLCASRMKGSRPPQTVQALACGSRSSTSRCCPRSPRSGAAHSFGQYRRNLGRARGPWSSEVRTRRFARRLGSIPEAAWRRLASGGLERPWSQSTANPLQESEMRRPMNHPDFIIPTVRRRPSGSRGPVRGPRGASARLGQGRSARRPGRSARAPRRSGGGRRGRRLAR
jgi:hypothetical protein